MTKYQILIIIKFIKYIITLDLSFNDVRTYDIKQHLLLCINSFVWCKH